MPSTSDEFIFLSGTSVIDRKIIQKEIKETTSTVRVKNVSVIYIPVQWLFKDPKGPKEFLVKVNGLKEKVQETQLNRIVFDDQWKNRGLKRNLGKYSLIPFLFYCIGSLIYITYRMLPPKFTMVNPDGSEVLEDFDMLEGGEIPEPGDGFESEAYKTYYKITHDDVRIELGWQIGGAFILFFTALSAILEIEKIKLCSRSSSDRKEGCFKWQKLF